MDHPGSPIPVTGNRSEPYRPFPTFVDWNPAGFDSTLVDAYAARLQQAKSTATASDLTAAVEVATRYAAVDTGAIEGLYSVDRGFTRTIATQSAAWESVLEARGPAVRDAIGDALDAYESVLDAATQRIEMSQSWIRELHELICRSQDTYRVDTDHGPADRPLFKGTYKDLPNSPTNAGTGQVHAYAPVLDTPPEMQRLVDELRSEPFARAHPVMQAAYAHYAYVCIHPFPDGNGRVARALASVYLYRSPGVPLVVFADQRLAYLDALEAADAGDAVPFVAFLADRTVDAIGLVTSTLGRSDLDAIVTDLRGLFSVDEDTPALAAIVTAAAKQALTEQIRLLDLPLPLTVDFWPDTPGSPPHAPAGFRLVGDEFRFELFASASGELVGTSFRFFAVAASTGVNRPRQFLCLTNSVLKISPTELEVWPRELVPALAESFRIRLESWARRELFELLDEVRVAMGGKSG